MNKEHRMLQQAKILRAQGLKQYQIAEILQVTERTVRNHLKNPATPRKIPERHSKLDPWRPLIDSILARKCHHFSSHTMIIKGDGKFKRI